MIKSWFCQIPLEVLFISFENHTDKSFNLLFTATAVMRISIKNTSAHQFNVKPKLCLLITWTLQKHFWMKSKHPAAENKYIWLEITRFVNMHYYENKFK